MFNLFGIKFFRSQKEIDKKEVKKGQDFNRVNSIIFNPDNNLKSIEAVKISVEKFQDDYGVCKLSKSLWMKYSKVYEIINNN